MLFIWRVFAAVALSFVMSEMIVSVMELLLIGRITYDYLITGGVAAIIVASLVVTIVLKLENKYTEKLRIASTAFESYDGMVITDADKIILRVNAAFTEITGYTADEAIGQTPHLLSSGRHDTVFYAAMWENIQRTGAWKGEIWNRRKNGELYPERITITAVKDNTGKITHYVGTLNDITEYKTLEEQAHNLAFHDPLTQLPNRRLLYDRLSQTMAASKRSGYYNAVMFIDLDNFKPINDKHGHDVGDSLLIEAGRRIASCVRETDTVSRLGGDEFVVLLRELDVDKTISIAQTRIVAEKIRAMLAMPYVLILQQKRDAAITVEHHCTVSIGVIIFINHEASEEDLIKRADVAMYQAKSDGRNLIRLLE
jgi:diguanylate cyclase (GGDEF)-like protein/PAS domain S-box-containing protein